MQDKKRYADLSKKFNSISKMLNDTKRLKEMEDDISEYRDMLESTTDENLKGEIRNEIESLENQREKLQRSILMALLPEDPLSGKNIIMEIRAGTGGDEAALFAADLFRMYSRYCERNGWKVEILSSHEIGIGGFKEIIFSISGKEVYKKLKYEMGVHRVQRIPV